MLKFRDLSNIGALLHCLLSMVSDFGPPAYSEPCYDAYGCEHWVANEDGVPVLKSDSDSPFNQWAGPYSTTKEEE